LKLHVPEVSGQRLVFRWDVGEGAYPLSGDAAWFEFPVNVDLERIGEPMLHVLAWMPHWPLLNLVRPVEVELGWSWPPSHVEVIQRLCDLQRAAYANLDHPQSLVRQIVILVSSGTPVSTGSSSHTSSGRPGLATCRSGGKESLTQVFLAREAGVEVVAVPTDQSATGLERAQ
jgi:hypothetical protein